MEVYADNAATTRMSRTAVEAMTPYFTEIYANPSSLHSPGQRAKEALEAARRTVAECLGCEPREIIFTSGGSEADNQAILSAAANGAKKGKKHIITTAFEHHAVLHTLKKLEKEGFEVTYLDVHENHNLKAQQVKDAIRPDTCLVTTMYANNEIGSVLPIAEIGAICKEAGVPFHTDAVQAAGHLHINVKEAHIDMLSLSAHKFHGPKGVGALYVRKGIPLVNVIEGGAQERGKRAGTENIPGICGMAAALKEACDHMDENAAKVSAMRDYLIQKGIDPARVLAETKSTSTEENLRFSAGVIAENGLPVDVAIASDNFHQLRSHIWAERSGLTPCSAGCASPWFLTAGYWAREAAALVYMVITGK